MYKRVHMRAPVCVYMCVHSSARECACLLAQADLKLGGTEGDLDF